MKREKFMDWAGRELDIKYDFGNAELIADKNLIWDFLHSIMNVKDYGYDVHPDDILKDMYTLIHNRPLTPLHNTESDWKKEGSLLVHRRLPTLVKNDGGTVYNAARAIVCDISDPKNTTYREATDNELAWLNIEHPIIFPYYPKSLPGTIFVMDTGNYRALIKYQDECDGKIYPLNLYFEVSGDDLEQVRFVDCAKEFEKLMDENRFA